MTESLDNILVAIADPTRRAIIARLAHGSARISDVATPFPMSLTGFCKHVRILEHAGLVKRTRHGRENTLALSARPLQQVADWVLFLRDVGFCYESLGNVQCRIAMDRTLSASERRDAARSSQEWYRKSIEIWDEWNRRGGATPESEVERRKVERLLGK